MFIASSLETFNIVDVHVLALAYLCRSLPHSLSVLDNWFTLPDVPQGKLVAEGNLLQQRYLNERTFYFDADGIAFFQPSGRRGNVIFLIKHKCVRHHRLSL
jgi:hypothetical protein